MKKTGLRWTFRPGISKLDALRRRGVKVGLFTNKHKRNIPVKLLQDAIGPGFQFDCILSGEQCYKPTPEYRRTHQMDKYDRIKPVTHYFPGDIYNDVRIIDDTPAKIPASDRHLLIAIETWDGTQTNTRALEEAIDKTDERLLPQGSQPGITNWVASEKVIITEHDTDRVETFLQSERVTVIRAGMGMGKTHQTHAMVKSLIEQMPSSRVCIVTSRVTFSRALMGLYVNLGFKHYQESGVDNNLTCSSFSTSRCFA